MKSQDAASTQTPVNKPKECSPRSRLSTVRPKIISDEVTHATNGTDRQKHQHPVHNICTDIRLRGDILIKGTSVLDLMRNKKTSSLKKPAIKL